MALSGKHQQFFNFLFIKRIQHKLQFQQQKKINQNSLKSSGFRFFFRCNLKILYAHKWLLIEELTVPHHVLMSFHLFLLNFDGWTCVINMVFIWKVYSFHEFFLIKVLSICLHRSREFLKKREHHPGRRSGCGQWRWLANDQWHGLHGSRFKWHASTSQNQKVRSNYSFHIKSRVDDIFSDLERLLQLTSCTSWSERSRRLNTRMCSPERSLQCDWIWARLEFRLVEIYYFWTKKHFRLVFGFCLKSSCTGLTAGE